MTDVGAITAITVDTPGDGYLTTGMRKFVDDLPLTCTPPACPADPAAKYLPTAVPTPKTYNGVEADEYVIGLVQYRTRFSSDLPEGTLVRGYVQLETPDNVRGQPALPADQRTARRQQGSRCGRLSRRHGAAVPGPVHRCDQGPAGADRVPQPAADGQRR